MLTDKTYSSKVFLLFLFTFLITGLTGNISYAEVIIDTIAGNGSGSYAGDNGRAVSATLNSPKGVAVDLAGNIYVADTSNNRIRKIDTAGMITTIVSTGLYSPTDVATDISGNIYIADTGNSRIQKLAGGNVTTVKTGLGYPRSVAADGNGNVYIADTLSNRALKIDSSGNTTVLSSSVVHPNGITVDGSGNIYVSDTSNNRILKLDAAGKTLGTFSTDAPGDLAADSAGNVYIVDENKHRILKLDTAGTISTVAGDGKLGYSGDGGTAIAAKLNAPRGVATDRNGNVYIADTSNHRIRRVCDDALKPVAPFLLLTLTPIASSDMTEVKLSWTDTSNETAFWIIRQEPSGGQETWFATVGTDILTYTEAIAQDKSCYYKVKAYSGGFYSDDSNRVAVNIKVSGDLSGDEKVGLEDAIYALQIAGGLRSDPLPWQERLEKKFDVAETFDNLQDWYGTKYSTGIGGVYAETYPDDFPKKTDGTSSMWCYYSNWRDPPAVKKPWISNFGEGTHFKTDGKSAIIDLSNTNGPGRLGTYFGNGDSTSGYKDVYLFYMVKISRKQWPTRCENQSGETVNCIGGSPTGIYEEGKDYLYWASWKFNTMGLGWNNCLEWKGSEPPFDQRYGSVSIIPHIKIDNYGPLPRIDGKPEQKQNLIIGMSINSLKDGPTQKPDAISVAEDTQITMKEATSVNWNARGCALLTDEWMGVEFHYTLEEPAGTGNNGKLEAWIYNQNGKSLRSFHIEGVNYLPASESGHRFNHFFFGGNNSESYDWGPTMESPYYVDDFIVDNEQIGPRYFAVDLTEAMYALQVVAGLK